MIHNEVKDVKHLPEKLHYTVQMSFQIGPSVKF